MAKLVRPCTSLTRRKQLSITKECPKEVFQELMAGLPLESEENGVEGLKRDAQGLLEPTKAPPHGRLRHFKYTLARASHRVPLPNSIANKSKIKQKNCPLDYALLFAIQLLKPSPIASGHRPIAPHVKISFCIV